MTGAEHDRSQLDRLMFFSDAIFAIAITLLVIEIHVPHLEHVTEVGLANALLALIPQYIGFIVSFFVIGRFWMGHHRAFGLLERADETLIWRNLLFLLTIAFLPFPTALVSSYAATRVGIGVYAVWLLLAGLLNLLVMRHATKGPLLSSHATAADCRLCRRAAWSPIIVALLALAVGMARPLYALIPLLASPVVVRLLSRRREAAA